MAITYYGTTQILGCPICGRQPRYTTGTFGGYTLYCHRLFHKAHFVVETKKSCFSDAVDSWNDAVLDFCRMDLENKEVE